MPEMITGLVAELGFEKIDKRLLRQALTHRSFTSEPENSFFKNNERLEFLGDSILGMIIADYLYKTYPDEQEGNLSKMKSVIVSEPSLAIGARNACLPDYLILSDCEYKTGGLEKESILSDAFEAVIAVIYLTVGEEECRDFIFKYLKEIIENCKNSANVKDLKGMLQEITQERFKEIPVYKLDREEGPSHDKIFEFSVWVNDIVLGKGQGQNKKNAQKSAALDALENYFGIKIYS
ncbi:MAG: ribonuclease III [Armatimonadetes bacterium]|nr:ribonuclease III [Candidatus Hippobium faecium]